MIRHRILTGGLSLWFLFLACVLDEQITFGQDETNNKNIQNIFLPAPRDLTQRLSRARKAVADERYSDAVTELGTILRELDEQAQPRRTDNMVSQDYFMGPRGEGGTYTSLKTEAQRQLGLMAPKGREEYELIFGSEARALLDEAVNKSDIQKLTDASRLYFHTKAGYEATMLLGRMHLDQGRPLAAALCFKRLADAPASTDFEPELSLLLATCWLYANMPENVSTALQPLDKKSGRRFRIGGNEIELPKSGGKSLEWLEKVVGKPVTAAPAEQLQWAMFRGNATRTGMSAGDLPLGGARWRVPTVNNPKDEELVLQATKRFMSQNIAAISSLHPLAVDDVMMMSTPEKRLISVDFKTGKRVWVYPWDDAATEDHLPQSRGQNAANPRMTELQQRLWEDTPYGQLSSDGNFVFLIDELGYVSHNPNMQFIVMARGGLAPNKGIPKTYNQLVALEIKTQGKIQWKVGDSDGQDEPKLANAFFLGPPLPLHGQLYCLAEVNGEIRLVVLNAKTGQLVWQQQLAHLENRTIQFDSLRRLAGASPSFADGVLVCPTSGGAVIAIDVSNRTLLWGYQYGQINQDPNRRNIFMGMQQALQKPIGQRWTDSTVTISEGRVLVTPPETDELICLDLLTGKLLWPAKKREELLYVGCVHEGKAILVGKDKITAINLVDGKNAWEAAVALPKGALVSGRGFHREGSYFLPTNQSQVVQIDLANAKILKTTTTEGTLGNLVCYRDEMISQNVDHLSTYLMVEPLRKRVAAALESDPQDAAALARLGELQLHDGQRQEALATLRKAHQLKLEDDSIRTLLVKSLLAALRDDFARNRSVATEIESLIEQPAQRSEYLRLMAAGLQQVGEIEASFGAFIKLFVANGNSDDPLRSDNHALEQIDPFHSVRRDRWMQSRLAGLYAAATPTQRQAMDGLIATQWKFASAQSSVASLRQFYEFFGFHPLADRAGVELGTRLRESDELLAAELLLARFEKHPDQNLAAAATYQLAKLLTQGKQNDLATNYYRRLAEEFADVVVEPGRTGRKCLEEAQASSELKASFQLVKNWSYGRVDVKENGSPTSQRFQMNSTVFPVTFQELDGPVIPSMNVVWDPQRMQSAVIRDGLGRDLMAVPLTRPDGRMQFIYYNASVHQARAFGHLLLLQVGPEVVAINLLKNKNKTEPLLWRDDLQQISDNNDNSGGRSQTQSKTLPFGLNRITLQDALGRRVGMMGPIRRGTVCYQRLKEIVCVDLVTGSPIWTRSNFDYGCELFGDDDRLFVVSPNAKEATVLSIVDGRELGRRPIDHSDFRLATFGRNLLVVSTVNQKYQLKLVDAWDGKELFSNSYAMTARAAQVGHDEFAVLQPDGAFEIISLVNGELRVRTNLEPESNLEAVRVFRSADQYLTLATRTTREATSGYVIHGVSGGALSRIISGKMYSFDRESGKSLWQTPAVIENYAVAEDQPTDVPVFTFLRLMNPTAGPSRNNMKTSVLCLDKRDGRALLRRDNIPGHTYVYEITGETDRKSVTVALQAKSFTLRLTDEPTPPEPPAQVSTVLASSGTADANAKEAVGGLFRNVGNGAAGIAAKIVEKAAAEAIQEAQRNAPAKRPVPDDDPFK